MRRPLTCVATLMAAALALAACSGSGNPASPTPTGRTSVFSSPSSAPTSGSPQVLTTALLAVTDLRGYHALKVTTIASEALPCTPHAPGLAGQFPPQTRAVAAYQSRSLHSSLRETLLGYPNAAAVDDVFSAARDGFNCSVGTLGGIRTAIANIGNVTGDGYRGERWDYRLANGTLGTSVIGQAGRVFVAVDFLAGTGGSGEIDPDAVLRIAMLRVRQHAAG